ncbi:cyclin-Q-like [Halichondria panicea]|uniref:cyclin-Q-like n=1 Tax=Halichondria panicea TaxID=6063 RepID=UPI00312B7082
MSLSSSSSKSESVLLSNQTPVEFLTEAGSKLSLSEEAICTAAYYYHKFNSTMTLTRYDIGLLLMATLNLASKVQEHSIKLGDVVNVCHRCWHKEERPLEIGDLYWQLKDSVARYELLLLRALKFDAQVKLPHSYLLHFLLAMSRWVDERVWSRSYVTRVAWALLQDSFHSDLCLRYPPVTVATSVLYAAVHCCELVIPCDPHSKPWWSVFSPRVSQEELKLISARILKLYD